MNTPVTNPGWMEPLMPPEGGQKRLEDAAFELVFGVLSKQRFPYLK
jgi:hypothetical protein